MSGQEKAQVVQSRLAWEPGDITQVSPDELAPHPKNREIYGDTSDVQSLQDTFVESVAEKGVLEPVVITRDKTLISGHRRWLAAQANGLDTIPARISEFEDRLAEREAVIEFNRQREKTPGQIVNEFEEMLEIEQERAKERKAHGETAPGKPKENASGNVSSSDGREPQARQKAAEKINADVSGRTLEKGKQVKEKAESEDEPKKVRKTAKKAWEDLETGDETFNGAYSKVKEAERDLEEEPETSTPELPDETYRAIVIDPPWDVEKIGRDERPDQGKYLDYPTMDNRDILNLPVDELAADSGAHIYLWTTQKHLPTAFECLDEWGARYECMMTWVKPTGVAPFSWQYNTEHVLFARFGDGLELEKNGLQLSFEAPVTEHSEKPDIFYERVKRASPAPRLEMFAREPADEFEAWGDEV